jgi:hypothetical protein
MPASIAGHETNSFPGGESPNSVPAADHTISYFIKTLPHLLTCPRNSRWSPIPEPAAPVRVSSSAHLVLVISTPSVSCVECLNPLASFAPIEY